MIFEILYKALALVGSAFILYGILNPKSNFNK